MSMVQPVRRAMVLLTSTRARLPAARPAFSEPLSARADKGANHGA